LLLLPNNDDESAEAATALWHDVDDDDHDDEDDDEASSSSSSSRRNNTGGGGEDDNNIASKCGVAVGCHSFMVNRSSNFIERFIMGVVRIVVVFGLWKMDKLFLYYSLDGRKKESALFRAHMSRTVEFCVLAKLQSE
jgi:hypothetical protein